MVKVKRTVTFRLYPTPIQEVALLRTKSLHCRLYNTNIEQRTTEYRQHKRSVTYNQQAKELTDLRKHDSEYKSLNAQSEQHTLKRVDRAFKDFFKRAKQGKTPGYPRFKSFDRFPGWGYNSHGDGWKLLSGPKDKHGRLSLSGIGMIRIRGKARNHGTPKTCTIKHKGDKWYASIVFDCVPIREHGTEELGFDWGLNRFLTFQDDTGVESPKWFRKAEDAISALQKVLARKKKGSNSYKKTRKQLRALYEKVANKRHNFLHQESKKLVHRCALIGTEALDVKNMSRSAKGTVENPGKQVAQKAGLNKSILDSAPGTFLPMVTYKAAEAGTFYSECPTRKVKPSQTCPDCKRQVKKDRGETMHICPCGCVKSRDQASAMVSLEYALKLRAGNQPSDRVPQGTLHETLPIPALVG